MANFRSECIAPAVLTGRTVVPYQVVVDGKFDEPLGPNFGVPAARAATVAESRVVHQHSEDKQGD
jgi:hypothetical protein